MTEKPTYEELEKKIQKLEQLRSMSKKAEEELYVNEERLRLAMQATHQSWFDLDLKTLEVTTSPEFESIIGAETDEAPTTYQGWIDSIHNGDRSAVLQTFSECLETGEMRQMEYRMKTRNRDWKWIHSSAKVVSFDENKLPVRMTGTHIDITERKIAEKTFLQKEKLKGVLEMAGAVCHELSQPAMIIAGHIEILQMTISKDNSLYEEINKIKNQVDRIETLTKKLMNIARYETLEYSNGKKIVDIDKASL